MDPPKEMTVSDVTEGSVTISWIKPMAPFEYYKLSYQSARGSIVFTLLKRFHTVALILFLRDTQHHCPFMVQLYESGGSYIF